VQDLVGADPRHPAMLIKQGDLAAVASLVSLSEFGEEELRENLNDVAWLEEKARAHERVLDEARSRMTVVPMRLCTIYRGEDQVREMLAREHDVFVDALRRLEGHTEWGVKLIADTGALERAASAPRDEGDEALTPGARTHGGGNDFLRGGPAKDRFRAGPGRNHCQGGTGHDKDMSAPRCEKRGSIP